MIALARTHGYEESLGDGRPLALQRRDELCEVDHLVDQLPLLHVLPPFNGIMTRFVKRLENEQDYNLQLRYSVRLHNFHCQDLCTP